MSKFWGYTFNENGEYYFPVELDSNNIAQISHFICDDTKHNKMVTDDADEPVITTIGEFLDRVDRRKIDFKSLQKAVIDLQEKCKFEDEIHMEL